MTAMGQVSHQKRLSISTTVGPAHVEAVERSGLCRAVRDATFQNLLYRNQCQIGTYFPCPPQPNTGSFRVRRVLLKPQSRSRSVRESGFAHRISTHLKTVQVCDNHMTICCQGQSRMNLFHTLPKNEEYVRCVGHQLHHRVCPT